MNEQDKIIKVGIGLMVFKEGKILLCKRKGSIGADEYAFPGGKLEYMESLEECARRETREECGIEVDNVKFLGLFNLDMYAPIHWIGVGMTAEWKSGEPQVLEPEKCIDWQWHEIDNLPQPLFTATHLMVDAYKKKQNFYDIDV